jgi:hypothetical protein
MGWPRLTHNDWVFQNSKIIQKLDDHFWEMEYIIGDGVFSPQNVMISAFKKTIVAPKEKHFSCM